MGRFRRFVKKAAKRVGKAAVGVGKGVLSGQSIQSAVRGQVQKEMASIVGQGGYRRANVRASRRRNIKGHGDYEMAGGSTNIMNPRTAYEPRMKNEVGIIEISRSEYLGDVVASATQGNFTLQNYFVNPGLDLSLGGASNWLAPIGASFQQYKYKQLVFEFRTTSGNSVAATNTSLGTVVMAANYDSSKPNYTNKQQMMDAQFAVSGVPSNNIFHPIECKASLEALKLWDVRTGPLTAGQSQNTYDFVNFQIATQGCPAASTNLGELWCHYTVCLEKTNLNSASSLIKTANYRWYGTKASNITSSYPIGQGGAGKILYASPGTTLPLTFNYTTTPQQIIFSNTISQGIYQLTLVWFNHDAATTWVAPTVGYVNCNYASALFDPANVNGAAGQTGAVLNDSLSTPTNKYYVINWIITVTAPGAIVTVDTSSATLGSTITDFALLVQELNPNAYVPGQ